MNVSASLIGANYVPSREWWWAWDRWDAASVSEDLDALAALGLDHIRIQCLWPIFQPQPHEVSSVALDRLGQLMEIASSRGLGVVPTLFDGWLSGFDFRPDWLGSRNIFMDDEVLRAQGTLLDAVAQVIGGRENLLGLDLGNEVNVLAHETPENSVGAGGADRWAEAIVDRARAAMGEVPLMIGVDNRPLTEPGSSISLRCAATVGDVSCVHAWPFFSGALERYGHDDPGAYAVADYFTQLFRAHHLERDRPVWVQEFGMSPEWVPEGSFETFVEAQIRATLEIDGLWGATWWASHDIAAHHAGFASLEYGLGLLDVDNRLKPAGRIMQRMIAEVRSGDLRPRPRGGAITAPAHPRGIEDADQFFAAYRTGQRPILVRSDRLEGLGEPGLVDGASQLSTNHPSNEGVHP